MQPEKLIPPPPRISNGVSLIQKIYLFVFI